MATVKFNLEADEARAVQAFLRVVDAQGRAEAGFRRTTNAAREQDDLLSNMGRNLGSFVTGFATIGTAIETATAALRAHNAEMEKGSARTRNSEFALGQLSQLAGGDPAKMRRMVEDAKRTSVESGMDLSQAAGLQVQLENFGLGDQRKMFSDLAGSVTDPGALAQAAVTLKEAFGEGMTGSIRAVLGKGLAAAGESAVDLNNVLTGSSRIAPGIQAIGGTDSEAMAALAVLSKSRPSSEQAGTEIQALSKVIMRQGLGGKGFVGGLDAVAQQVGGMSDAEKVTFFGDMEGFRGFTTLNQNRADLVKTLGKTQAAGTAGPGDMVDQTIAARLSIPELASAQRVRMAEQGLGDAQAGAFGVAENNRLAMLNQIEQTSLQKGEGFFRRFLRTSAAEGAKFLGGDEQDMLRAAGATGNWSDVSGSMEFIDAVRELSGNIKAMNGNVQTGKLSRNGAMVE